MKRYLSRAHRRLIESARIARFGVGLFGKSNLFIKLVIRSNDRCYPMRCQFQRKKELFSYTFRSHAELMLFHEIFALEPYQVALTRTPRHVIDIGANIGISTLFLLTEYPDAKIAAVEPNPALAGRLAEAVGNDARVTIVRKAVGGNDGDRTFYASASSPVSSSLVPRTQAETEITIPTRTLESLAKTIGFNSIDFIKFDIEGAEWEAFESFPGRNEIMGLSGEFHEDLSGKTIEEFLNLWDRERMQLTYLPTAKKSRYILQGVQCY